MPDGVILLVEDDEKLNNANRRALEMWGYAVRTALTLARARELLEGITPDVILLDVMLPDGSGFDFCAEIREKTHAHILFLTAQVEQENIFKGLTCGGDDYITKPFHVKELLLRVNAAMRRRNMNPVQKVITKGALTLDMVSDTAFSNGKDLLMSQKEFHILRLLVENEGKTLEADYIFDAVWGKRNTPVDKNTLRNRISGMRKKLEDEKSGYTIEAAYGKGYFLQEVKF